MIGGWIVALIVSGLYAVDDLVQVIGLRRAGSPFASAG